MKRIVYNKLVRDRIPEIIREHRAVPKTSTLSLQQFKKELRKKVLEEGCELMKARNREKCINELADLLELIKSIAESEKIKWNVIMHYQRDKRRKRGGFTKRIFLHNVTEQ